MWSAITSVISIIKALLSLWDYWKQYQEASRVAEALKKKENRDKAIEDLKNAKTQDEIFDAQDRVLRNKPTP